MERKGQLIVVSGFAGTGKGTLMKMLLERYPQNYVLSVSATTRAPRQGEVDGVHYFFKEKTEFEKMIQEDQLLEYAQYVDNYYGTPKSFVKEQQELGKDVILEIEIQGALKIKEQFPEAILLYVLPPSAKELKDRLVGRGTETEDVIAMRLKRATQEACGIEEYDYIIVNDVLEECVVQMHEIIKAAHFTPDRQKEFLDKLREDLKVFE